MNYDFDNPEVDFTMYEQEDDISLEGHQFQYPPFQEDLTSAPAESVSAGHGPQDEVLISRKQRTQLVQERRVIVFSKTRMPSIKQHRLFCKPTPCLQ